MDPIQTDLIHSRFQGRQNAYTLLSTIFFILATLYLFFIKKTVDHALGNPNAIKTFHIVSIVLYINGLFLLIRSSFFPPKKLGFIKFHRDKVEIKLTKGHEIFSYSGVNKVIFRCRGHRNFWTSLYGAYNYLVLDNQRYEVQLHSAAQKKQIKRLLREAEKTHNNITIIEKAVD